MKFKVGDKAKIIGNETHHGYKLGELVQIRGFDSDECIETRSLDRSDEDWHVGPEDIELIEEKTTETSMRFNNGKASIFDAPLLGMVEVSKVTMYGRSKYDAFNWKKPTHATELLDCIFRHFIKVMYGLDNASDSKSKEMAHLAWNALAYLEKEAMGTLIDDRHKYPPEKIALLESFLMLSEDQKKVISKEEEKKRGKND